MSRMPDVPGTILNTFGSDNVRALCKLLTTGEVLEADTLVLNGDISPNDIIQYVSLLPEYDEVEKNLIEISAKMVNHLKPKLRSIITATTRGESKGGIRTLYNLINNLIATLEHLQGGYRNIMVIQFRDMIFSRVFSEIEGLLQPSDQSKFIEALTTLDYIWHKQFGGLDFIGTRFLREKYNYRDTFRDSACVSVLSDLAPKKSLTVEESEGLTEENKRVFDEIKDLREYRRILFTPFQLDRAKVAIMADDFLEIGEGTSGICYFQVVLSHSEPLQKPIVMKHGGGKAIDMGTRHGVLNLNLNRCNGEFTLLSNQGISISELMDSAQYLQLKQKLFQILVDYLRGKEPDIEDAFLPKVGDQRVVTHEAAQSVVESTSDQAHVVEASIEMDESILTDIVPAEEYLSAAIDPSIQEQQIPYEPVSALSSQSASQARGQETAPCSEPPESPAPLTPDRLRKRRKQEFIKRINKLSTERLFRILIRLMEGPERISGGHQFFRSPKNNVIRPIPYHSKPVKFPLLRQCLIDWDLIEEFSEELGV